MTIFIFANRRHFFCFKDGGAGGACFPMLSPNIVKLSGYTAVEKLLNIFLSVVLLDTYFALNISRLIYWILKMSY